VMDIEDVHWNGRKALKFLVKTATLWDGCAGARRA